MSKSNIEIIDEFSEITDIFNYFIENKQNFRSSEACTELIKVYNSIIFDKDRKSRKIKMNYFVFWVNSFLQQFQHKLSQELRISLMVILDKLNLHQLISYLRLEELDLDIVKSLNCNLRSWFDERLLSDAQMRLFEDVFDNKNVVFSAPTSYGKTMVMINSLIAHAKAFNGNNYIFILPTKALINEYRLKIIEGLNDLKAIINENPFYKFQPDKITFHLFTQERFLIYSELNKNIKIDYTVFDEAQDLINILKADQDRAVLLAKSISIIGNRSPMIFLMPYVANPVEDIISKFVEEGIYFDEIADLISPTSSKKYLIIFSEKEINCLDVSLNKGYGKTHQTYALKEDCKNKLTNFYEIKNELFNICNRLGCINEKSLCYCKKNEISKTATLFIKDKEEVFLDERSKALIKYLEKYLHADFELVEFIKKGVAIHHADLDAFSKRQIEKIFSSDSNLNMIFCTSTLLEGVNLNAKNLFFLAQKGRFTNAKLDKKNLFGRVGRLGDFLQGNVYKFWVEGQREKPENIINEMNNLNEEYIVEKDKFNVNNIKKRSEILDTYLQDMSVNNNLTKGLNKWNSEMSNFDYFIGNQKSNIVDQILQSYSLEKLAEIEDALLLRSVDDCKNIVALLCEIYEWKQSANFDESHRMVDSAYIGSILFDNMKGIPISKVVNDILEKHKKGDKYILAIFGAREDDEYPKLVKINSDYRNYEKFKRVYLEKDINLLIYSYIYDIQNIIEFRLKKYIQDIYYRLLKRNGKTIESIEDFLIYSTANNKRKISLNEIGMLDSFAIDEIIKEDSLFVNDQIEQGKLILYGESLATDEPLKYAIQDVLS